MSFYVRFAQKGEEAPLARIHVSAFSIPDEAFVFPHYRDFTSYNLAMAQAKYAKFIQKGSVACAVEAESGRLVGLHCWILPGVPHESGHSNQRYELVSNAEPEGYRDTYRYDLVDIQRQKRERMHLPQHIDRTGLAVDPAYHRRGVATLLKFIAEYATKLKLPSAVTTASASSIVHSKAGYKTLEHVTIVDERPGHTGSLDVYFQEWRFGHETT